MEGMDLAVAVVCGGGRKLAGDSEARGESLALSAFLPC